MRLGDYSAFVIVDDKELEEFDIEVESATKATCWIPSEEGKKFGVKWQCHARKRPTHSSGRVEVDGISCRGSLINPGPLGIGDTRVRSYVSCDTMTRDLMFSRLQLSDDEALLDKSNATRVGEISLEIIHGAVMKKQNLRPSTHLDVPDADDKLHEKAKKATAHRVGFGPEKPRNKIRETYNHLIPNHDPPLVFVFKYRPLDVLQANGIAPKPAIPASQEAGSDDEIDIQDAPYTEDIKPRELNDRIQSLENELKRLRSQQVGASEDRKPKRVKKEPGVERRPKFTPGEVIDLT
ncbi:hypothetical protein HYDPIDRAFT_43389 [Hydnomerulius pinastri MD-312]|uniref:DUF7918 domain-containing protein n=1 Tax=Hydnomerulius pinastri MD-312 TaxID=994086 RepID=A0A0C9VRE1_9AGAM|nr:hypothetical protein HYDPIDRAFT_43389 [Hydnomerulius pinastri MD-312]